SRIGGAERSLTRMADYAIHHLGADIRFASMGDEGEWNRWLSELGHQPASVQHCKCPVIKAWHIMRYVQADSIDVVYVIGLRLSVYMRFLKLIMRTKSRLVNGIRWVPAS